MKPIEGTLPARYVKLIGRIVEQFSSMELGLMIHIQTLILLSPDIEDERAFCLVASEDFSILLAKLDKLFRYTVTEPKMLQAFNKLRIRLEDLNVKRNKYVHTQLWDVPKKENRSNKKPDHVHLHKFKRSMSADGSMQDFAIVTPADLQTLIDDAREVEEELTKLIENNLVSIATQWDDKLESLKRE